MKKFALLFGFAATALLSVQAEFVTDLTHGWRFTVGPQFNMNARGRLGIKSSTFVPYSSFSSTKSIAETAGQAEDWKEGVVHFSNGAFIDSKDAAQIHNETWNWHIPSGELKNGQMSISHAYTEISRAYESVYLSDHDESFSVGTSLGIERAIWKWNRIGVEAGFGFNFFIKDNWFKGSAGRYTETITETEGSYDTHVNLGNRDILNDPWTANLDGSYGAGSFAGPGPVLDLSEVSISHQWGAESTRSSSSVYGPFSIRGDLQMYEFQFALKPYFDVTDWLRIRGTLGLGVDYRRFDVELHGYGRDSTRDWDVYMICGLGGMIHWDHICVGADFLRKVFDDSLDVDTHYVEGSINNANWMFRVYLGYEF